MQLNDKKAIFGWNMYDWANSSFATTIMAGFFPIFFKDFWNAGVDPTISTARLGIANSLAGILVAILAPVLGAIADRGTAKKKFLLFFAYLGVLMSFSLFFIAQGHWLFAVILYMFGTIGFSGSLVFYDSLLPSIVTEDKMDVVSGLGYGYGYLGGGLLFAVNVWMSLKPATFGLTDAAQAVRFSFLSVAIWWAVFSIPLMLFVKEPKEAETVSKMTMVKDGLRQLQRTFREIRHLKMIFLFLAAYWLYIDGVDTVIRMAVDYGMSLGFKPSDLILALLLTQFIGFPAAIGFGYLGKKIGAKRGIFIAIAAYLFISIWAAFMTEKNEFYALAIVIGCVQGGIQSLSRSFYARIIPANKAAEYFGFYNMLGKFATVIGPVLMGGVGLLARSMGFSSNIASRLSLSSLSLLFLIGGALFYFVDEQKAAEDMRYLSGNGAHAK